MPQVDENDVESEVQSLIEQDTEDKDGSAEEETQNDETSTDDSGKEESIDWSKLPQGAKKQYEDAVKKAEQWERNHAKIQSEYTKSSQEAKKRESTYKALEERAAEYERLEAWFEQNKWAQELLQKGAPKEETPEYLQKDPAYQYARTLEEKVQKLEQLINKDFVPFKQQYENQSIQREADQYIDKQIEIANSEIKSLFGRDASKEEVESVLNYMVENKVYDAESVVLKMYKGQARNAWKQQVLSEMKEKGTKNGVRNKSVNSARVAETKHARTPDEAIKMALEELSGND